MSFDVYIDHPGIISEDVGNVTYNVSGMFYIALTYGFQHEDPDKEFGLRDLDGMDAQLAIPILERAMQHFWAPENQEAYARLNPANGWGDVSYARKFLQNLLDKCREWPDGKIDVQ